MTLIKNVVFWYKLLIIKFLNNEKNFIHYSLAVVLAATVNAQTTATYTFFWSKSIEVLSETIDSNLTL